MACLLLALASALGPGVSDGQLAPGASEMVARGVEEARKGNFTRAIEILERALLAAPNHHDARYNLALARYDARDYPGSAAEFRKVLAARPGDTDARRGLGLVRLALGQYAAAVATLDQALAA